ncbi:hypothetical protein [Nitratireductor sp. XY-223]|uniref:hypothetical protein n=1 Tax=Nitratireductor sp. XY-223 TaxID=2561926 RepID=UPI0010AAA85F|nr:hypothetical protein [Nitratireductor sp. XY-223]
MSSPISCASKNSEADKTVAVDPSRGYNSAMMINTVNAAIEDYRVRADARTAVALDLSLLLLDLTGDRRAR